MSPLSDASTPGATPPDLCWICRINPANSGEHRLKASDVRARVPGLGRDNRVLLQRGRATNDPIISAKARILKYPNDYQTPSDFMLNLVRHLYLEGNAFAMAVRNDPLSFHAPRISAVDFGERPERQLASPRSHRSLAYCRSIARPKAGEIPFA